MFRPARFLQVAVASIWLSACAATSTGGVSGANPERPAPTIATSPQPASAAAPQAPSNVVVTGPAGDFIGPDGRLLPEFEAFAADTAQSRQISYDLVESLLTQARYDSVAARLMAPPKGTRRIRRAWQSYRKRHVDPIRIREGVAFWQQNQRALAQASLETGVPEEIIVAIVGIETVYGRYTGEHRVLDTLTTLGFRYPDASRPERQAMFRAQLADLLVLHQQGMLDARLALGSYAGAMGLPQFMPGSLARWARDGDGDGRIDLASSAPDAIASIANFLRVHGWVRDVPVFAPVSLPANSHKLAQSGLTPQQDWAGLQALGVLRARSEPAGAAWQTQPLGIIDLADEARRTHDVRCATPNFFAITHYNRSYFYAAAVADLADEIARRRGRLALAENTR